MIAKLHAYTNGHETIELAQNLVLWEVSKTVFYMGTYLVETNLSVQTMETSI
jgi:hypothetical protein